ncbi:Asp23/Gls24 family envelope stress response protein [Microlunatus antarcticus]|uniref:Putative alkaline shock family protein YloU n=1 Tax=Microlunatus antarcticus TaxID=53388 RepID=A0A7W5JVW3_9ACTN|nr:Asp23/Gls24 family envelope stress response protein [Microlunatus antarcticus]MBB3327253.1 putative alkaline shock family protein YloU [Microlunatus antarcticus]
MSQSVVPSTGEERRQAEAQAAKNAERHEPKELDALHTEHGDTTIADGVVAKIAGIAAREVSGVYAMGNAARRAIGNLAQRLPGSTQPSVSGGVSVEKGERETAIEITVVVDYGVSIVTVSDQIRENVIAAVEYGTGLDVVSVDVSVTDVHLPDEDDDTTSGTSSDSLR